MRYTRLFGKTLRKVSHNIKRSSYALLLQGGYIRSLGGGLFSLLPLGLRVTRNICEILREELDALGGQEVAVPMVNPLDIWLSAGRADLIEKGLVRFRDRTGRDLVLSPSHEEAMVELLRIGLNSYRDLPVFLYQFQSKFRDEERTRGGMIRAKEFVMSDAYSFHRSFSDLNNFFPKVFTAYERIFSRCGLDIISAEAGVGFMGGEKAYEFLLPSSHGEDVVISCRECGYRANRDVAMAIKDPIVEGLKPLERIDTPGCTNMKKLSKFLDIPRSKLIKSMIYRTKSGPVMAVVRADYEVSTEKLSRCLKQRVLGLASLESLEDLGLVPGFVSPIDMQGKLPIVVDDIVADSNNLVIGGNERDTHYTNANFGRDFEADTVGDIVRIRGVNRCIQCRGELEEIRAIEVGNIFKLGEFYSRAMNLCFRDDQGREVYPNMGSYGIGIGRLMSVIAEANSDEKGICWPKHLAPYKIFLMGIGKSLSVKRVVDNLYEEIADITLFDERPESPGVKFKDADLIGIPYRIVVTPRLLRNEEAEVYERKTGNTWTLPLEHVAKAVREL